MAASGTLRRPGRPGTQARSALGAQRRAPSAERVARGGDRARRMRRARSAHATGAERVARGGASCELACWRSQHTDTLGGFCLLAHNSNIVGGLKTMSPAPGRRPPINTPPLTTQCPTTHYCPIPLNSSLPPAATHQVRLCHVRLNASPGARCSAPLALLRRRRRIAGEHCHTSNHTL